MQVNVSVVALTLQRPLKLIQQGWNYGCGPQFITICCRHVLRRQAWFKLWDPNVRRMW